VGTISHDKTDFFTVHSTMQKQHFQIHPLSVFKKLFSQDKNAKN